MDHASLFSDVSIGLAPMEGVTDFPARLWFQLAGNPAIAGTPFLRVTDTYPVQDIVDDDIWPELTWASGAVRYEIVPQLMASNPKRLAQVATRVLERSQHVELNCGCPAPRVVGGGAGSSMLRDPEEFERSLKLIANHMPAQHLSIKIRTGFADDVHFEELVEAVGRISPLRLVIHGRTRFQHYTGLADWGKISEASKMVACPVIGSGDVNENSSALLRLRKAPRIRGMIIGRGAMRNPWIFDDLRSGKLTALHRQELLYALATYALLVHAYRHELPKLRHLTATGFFSDWCRLRGTDQWQNAYQNVCFQILGHGMGLEDLDLPKAVLGRVKMFWNSMRTSLPAEAMEPTLLRQKSLGSFFRALDAALPGDLPFRYQPQHDWLFSGQRREE